MQAALCICCLFLSFHPTVSSITHTLNGFAWNDDVPTEIEPFNTWVGRELPIVQIFADFCQQLIWQYPLPIWNQRGIPMITLQPQNPACNGVNPTNIATLIAQGQYDSYLATYIANTKSFLSGANGVYGDSDDRRLYFRFAHEANGDWYAWSGNTAAYVQMYQHVWNLFHAAGITNTRMQWVWCVNWEDVPTTLTAEAYFPGTAYVDWVAVDGYNNANSQTWSSWMQPNAIFANMVGRLNTMAPGKPIGIAETGCSTSGYTLANKSQWILDLYTYALANNIKFLIWFNIETGYTDYGVFGSRNGPTSYVSPVTGSTYLTYPNYATKALQTSLSLETSNVRILTDAEFEGSFT